ncbi:MAG: acyl-CoA dehydrogenase family protein [Gammaproteobacteria bacterium]|nr:acyl-CoA dehydrogenase family protein [Gammaproteobacteria bacterium]
MSEYLSEEERRAIRESFARLLAKHCTESDVRRLIATPEGYDRDLWRRMADMGVLGLLVDPTYGGSGAGAVELESLMEEAGAALLPGPLLSSGVLGSSLFSACTDDGVRLRLLPGLASGDTIASVALTGDSGTWRPDGVSVDAAPKGDAWLLTGCASFVTWACAADVLLVAARAPDGLGVFLVEDAQSLAGVTALQTHDPTLHLSRVVFKGVDAVRLPGLDESALEQAMNLARIALAGEQAGAARRVLDGTVEYIRTRVQFGRPVGGFQAIKHMAADLLLEVESATSVARQAASAFDEGDADSNELISLAAFACADAFVQTASSAIQMHGGIGFTWDHWAHLYWRRARADAQLFGGADFYRDRYLAAKESRNAK